VLVVRQHATYVHQINSLLMTLCFEILGDFDEGGFRPDFWQTYRGWLAIGCFECMYVAKDWIEVRELPPAKFERYFAQCFRTPKLRHRPAHEDLIQAIAHGFAGEGDVP